MSNKDFPPGTGIRFKNLKSMPQLNGKLGHVLDQLENGRYRVITTHVNNYVSVRQEIILKYESDSQPSVSKFRAKQTHTQIYTKNNLNLFYSCNLFGPNKMKQTNK